MSEIDKKRLQAWIPKQLYEKAQELSDKQGRTLSDVVSKALVDYVSEGEMQKTIEELRARISALENIVKK